MSGIIGTVLCNVCQGTGWRRRRAGDEKWDEYVEEPLTEAMQPTGVLGFYDRAQNIRRLTHELEKLEADAAAREGRLDQERFGWERQRQAMERAGSYRELRRVLRQLDSWWPEGFQLLRRRYWLGVPVIFDARQRGVIEMAEAWLAHTMRGSIRVPPWILEQRAQARVETVASLAAEGMTAGVIARRLRMPKEKVRRLLKRVRQ